MKKQKDELATLSPQQANPYTAVPEDFEVGRADEFSSDYVPGHGQCGKDKKEYSQLLAVNAKPGKPQSRATEASDAGKPKTRGIDGPEGV